MKKIGIVMLVLMMTASSSLFAACPLDDNANSSKYLVKFPSMIGRGVVTIITSPAEIVVHAVKGTKEGKPVLGTLVGLGEGIGWTLDHIGRGVLDIVTSFIPNYHGSPPTHKLEL